MAFCTRLDKPFAKWRRLSRLPARPSGLMRQFITIAINAFMELVRQPVFLLLMTSSAVFIVFLATPYYFAFGDEPKLVKNSALDAGTPFTVFAPIPTKAV